MSACFFQLFHEYAGRLALFLRLEGMWEEHPHPLNSQLLPLLKDQPPPWPGSGLFARLKIPLFLHRKNSVSYPLFFGAALP